ncbi:MAG: electron transfer flavoprotein subunit alpha/FixB family protein, partial [Bacteroidota bacterium]|nr:electron transfer flavoprotein subunit alpha/FixB family protein [Bacteroidota bacterium]
MSTLVYTQNFEGKFKKSSFELISYASELNKELGGLVTALTIGEVSQEAAEELSAYGAEKLLVVKDDALKDFSLLAYAKTIAEAAKTEEAKVVLFGTNPEGKALAPAVTVYLDASVAAEVVALPTSYEPFTI